MKNNNRLDSYKKKIAVYAIKRGMTEASHKFNLSRQIVVRYKNQFAKKNPTAYQNLLKDSKQDFHLRRYTAEQKAEAVKTALSTSIREASRQIGASEVSVRNWIKQVADYGGDFLELQNSGKRRRIKEAKRNDPERRYLYSRKEVAEYLDLNLVLIGQLVKSGEIKGELVGGGEERSSLIFPVAEADKYHLARIKEKLGDRFACVMLEANLVVLLFLDLSAEIGELKSSTPEAIESVCPADKRTKFIVANTLYKSLHKDVRRWVYNRLRQADSGDEKNNVVLSIKELGLEDA